MSVQFTSIEQLESAIGQEFGPSPWRQVTQDDVTRFAELTDDLNWIHVDPERAANEGPFGGTIAHGYLTLALVPAIGHQLFTLEGIGGTRLNYGLDKVRFPAPVPTGSRVRGRATITALTPVSAGRQLTVRYVLEVDGGVRPACVADMITLLIPRR